MVVSGDYNDEVYVCMHMGKEDMVIKSLQS